jgi:hypothetical protein
MSSDISPSEYRSVAGPPDLKSGREFWYRAQVELGRTESNGYDEKNLLFQSDLGQDEYAIKDNHDMACDDLSRQIAIETGQAKEISPGQVRQPIVTEVSNRRSGMDLTLTGPKSFSLILASGQANLPQRLKEIAIDQAASLQRQTRTASEHQALLAQVRKLMPRQTPGQGMER